MECTNIINVNRWFQNSHKLYFYLKGSGHHQCSCSLPLCCRPNGELSNQKLLPSHKHTHTHTDKHTHTKTHTQTHTQTHAHTMVSNQKLLPSHSLFDPETQNQPRSHPATHPTNFVVSSPMMIKELTKHLCLFITVSRYITCYEGQREKFNLTYYKTDCWLLKGRNRQKKTRFSGRVKIKTRIKMAFPECSTFSLSVWLGQRSDRGMCGAKIESKAGTKLNITGANYTFFIRLLMR